MNYVQDKLSYLNLILHICKKKIMYTLLKWGLRIIAIVILCFYLPQVHLGGEGINKFTNAAIVAVLLSFLNTFVKPILSILSLPITFMTLGLFRFVVNAIIVLLAAKLLSFFNFGDHWLVGSLLFSILLSFVYGLIDKGLKSAKEDKN
jgi:putative membrane protein